MKRVHLMNKIQNLARFLKQHRKLSVICSLFFISTSVITLGLVNIFLISLRIPDFNLSSLRIVKVENNTIETDISLDFVRPVTYKTFIERIDCKIYQSNSSGDLILAEGKTTKSFMIHVDDYTVQNLSFIFNVPNFNKLIKSFLGHEKIGLKGRIFLTMGFSVPFSYQPQEVEFSFLPEVTIHELHPIAPGSYLEILAGAYNPHNITINITEGKFQLSASDYGFLGNASLKNVSMNPGYSNVTLLFQAKNTTELIWIFEKILNNGSIEANIQNLEAQFTFAGEKMDIIIEDGPPFLWRGFSPGLQILDIENLNLEEGRITFDIILGFKGEPLWGYNITPIYAIPWGIAFDFSLKWGFLNVEGNGSSNLLISVNRKELTPVPIDININLNNTSTNKDFSLLDQQIEINVYNGQICLQFYEVKFQVRFQLQS